MSFLPRFSPSRAFRLAIFSLMAWLSGSIAKADFTLFYRLQYVGQPYWATPYFDQWRFRAPIITDTFLPAGDYQIVNTDGVPIEGFVFPVTGAGAPPGTVIQILQNGSHPGYTTPDGLPWTKNWTTARLIKLYDPNLSLVGYASGGTTFRSDVTLGGSVQYADVATEVHLTYSPATVQPPPGQDEHWWKDACGRWHWHGMAGYSVDLLHTSLVVGDTPLFYEAGFGPAMEFTALCQQIDPLPARQSSAGTSGFSHLGPGWSFNWLSYISDTPGSDVPVDMVSQGFLESFTNFDTATQSYAPHRDARTKLVRLTPNSYELRLPDGARRLYQAADGATQAPRRVYLSQIVDPQGNAVTLTYGASNRLTRVTDATGRWFDLLYEDGTNYYRITRVLDSRGRAAVFLYHPDGWLRRITDPVGVYSQFAYDTAGALTTLTTPYGGPADPDTITSSTPSIQFVAGGGAPNRSLEITDPMGGRERYEFREWCRDIPDSDPAAPTGVTNSGLQYRNSFHWSKKAMAGMPPGTVDYTKAEITHWLTQGSGVTAKTVAVVHSSKAPLEGRRWFQYPAQPNAEQVGSLGLPSRISRVLDDGSTQAWQFINDNLGHVTQATDPVGRITTSIYAADNPLTTAIDESMDLLSIKQREGAVDKVLASFANYSNHLPQSLTDAAGQAATIAYNTRGQTDAVTNVRGEITNFTYVPSGTNGYGKVQSVTRAFGTALAATTQYTYDSAHRLATVQDVDGYTLAFGYEAIAADPLKTLDRLTRITYPDGTYEETTWNRLDAEWLRDRRGRLTHQVHDALQRVTDVTDPLSRTTHYEWCTCGALEQLRDAAGNFTTWMRDLQSRPISKIIGAQTVAQYTYEVATGRLKTTVDALSQTATYGYTADDRMAGVTYTGTVLPTPNLSFAYDPNYPRVLSTTAVGQSSILYSYVPMNPADTVYGDGQIASVTGVWGDLISYSYDNLGRPTGRQIGGAANASTWGFDVLGRGTAWTNLLGTFTPQYVGVTGRLDWLARPGGGKVDFDWFDNLGDRRLKEIKHLDPAAAVVSKFNYLYDAAGEITRWTQWHSGLDVGVAARRWELGYDLADQLVRSEVRDDTSGAMLKLYGYAYDLAGNRTSEQADSTVLGAAVNGFNQITGRTAGGKAQVVGAVSEPATVKVNGTAVPVSNNEWRAELNVVAGVNTFPVEATETNFPSGTSPQTTTKTLTITVPGSAAQTLSYDLNGSMTADGTGRTYQWDGANRLVTIIYPGNAKARFSYDALGHRVKIVEEDAAGTVTGEKRFVWEGLSIAEERDASNAVIKRFFAEGEQQGAQTYLTTRDHLGSIRELLTTTGTVSARYDYDPYGKRTKLTGTAEATFGYTGHYYHATSGLHLAMFRGYDATLGRWLSRDPIEEQGGLNLYHYTFNNPINWVDPTGLDVWIEGASGNEPKPHISINVGNPNGSYYSQSFGVIDFMTRGLWGGVYEDTSTGGNFLNYLKTTPEQDALIEEILRKKEGNEARYGPVTCRSYTKDQFNGVKNALGISENTPPTRTPAPATGIRQYLNPVTPVSSSSSTDASSKPTQGTRKPTVP